MAKKIFYAICFILILAAVVLVGATIEVSNPLVWLLHIVGVGGVFVAGYALGRKSK